MNTLRKEDLLLEQPTIEEQKELQTIFEELEIVTQDKIDILMAKCNCQQCGCNGWGGGWCNGSCSGCKK